MEDYKPIVDGLLEESDKAVNRHTDKELKLIQYALDISKDHHYDVGIFESHLRIGNYLMFNGQNEEAIEHFEICYAVAQTLNDSLKIATTANCLGITYYNLGICSKSLDCLLEALNIASTNGYIDIECRVYNNICGILDEFHDYETSIHYLFDILQKCSCRQDDEGPVFPGCIILRNIAHTFHGMGKLPEAEEYVNLAIEASINDNNLQMLCESYFILGLIRKDQKLLNEAYECFIKALSLAEKINSSAYLVKIRIHLSTLFAEKGIADDAYQMAKEAYCLAIELDCPSLTKDAASTVADICQMTGNKDMLIEALISFKTVSLLMEEENVKRQQAYTKAQLMLFNLKKDNERLRVEVERDALTGCLSSRTFPDRISHALSTYGNTGALVFLDVDNLKQINDTYGHDVGDALLKSFAQDLKEVMPAESIKIRISGDEFLVFLPRAGKEEAAGALDLLLKALSKPRKVGEVLMPVQCSAGIALYPEHSSDIDNLRKLADTALYAAKQAGRGIYRIYNAS